MKKILIYSIAILIFSCTSKKQENPQTPLKQANTSMVSLTDAQIKNAGIELGSPQLKTVQSILKVNGLIDLPPQGMFTVSFPSGGYLKRTSLLPGMKIIKGQIIATMEDQSFIQMQQDYLMAKTKVKFLQKEYERQKLLNETKATSDKLFQQTESDYQSERITVKSLAQKLLLIGIDPSGLSENAIQRTVNLHAPISGYVSAVRVSIGKYVSPTDVLFDLVNTNDLHLALTVFEKDLGSIHPGQIVNAYLTSDTTKIYKAKVVLVGKTIDSTRSASVHCHFLGDGPNLLPGMFMNASIQLTNQQAVTVPEDAVVRSGDKDYIFIGRGNKQFELTPVTTSITQKGFTVINNKNESFLNEVIINKNAYAVLMKMKNTGDEE